MYLSAICGNGMIFKLALWNVEKVRSFCGEDNKKSLVMLVAIIFFIAFSNLQVMPVKARSYDFAVVQVFWGSGSNIMQPTSGDQNVPLSVVTQNVGENVVNETIAYLDLSDSPFTNIAGEDEAIAGYPEAFLPGQTVTFVFTLNIAADAEFATYNLEMDVHYRSAEDGEYRSRKIDVPVLFFGRAIISVAASGSILSSGSTNNLKITLANEGTAEILSLDVVLALPTPGPLALMNGDNHWHFKSIKPDSSVVIETQITVAENVIGTYQLGLALSYRDPTGYTYVETRTIGVSVSLEVPSSLVGMTSYTTSLETFHQEENFTISLNIKNLGDSPAEAVTVDLVVPAGFAPLSPTTISIGDLLPGSTIPIEFEILISSTATPGVAYMLEFDISYTDSLGRERVTRTYVGIPVYGRLEVVVYDIKVKPHPLTVGSEMVISGTILNRGNVDAKYTNVTIVPGSPLNLWLGSTDYIGRVRPDSPTSFQVTSDIDSNAKIGTYSVTILVSYEDDRYVKHSFTKTIQIQVAEKPSPSPYQAFQEWVIASGWMYVVAAAGLTVILSALYLCYRRRRSGG